MSYAEFEATTKRNARRVGVFGAILGAVVSVVGTRLVWIENVQHNQFDRLASLSTVQQQRRLVQAPAEAIPDPYAQQKKSDELSAQPKQESDSQSALSSEVVLGYSAYDPPPTEVNADGIKVIHWTRDYGVESLDMDDGRSIHPTPEPSYWAYFLIAMCPAVGFFIPWGAVRLFSGEGILFSHHHAEGQEPTARPVRPYREN